MPPLARLVAIVGLFGGATLARADELTCPCTTQCCTDDAPYVWSFQFMSGSYRMTSWGPPGGFSALDAKIDYLPQSFRVGCELDRPFFCGKPWEGTYELLLEYNYCHITKMFGSYFTGPGLLLRYNYKACDPCLVPYTQVGAGLTLTDSYRDQSQELIGQAVEFILQAEIGLRCRITECLSLDIEGGLQHVSNASLASRNGGINNLGFSVGFTYTFGK